MSSYAKANFDFEANDKSQISFKRGDIIQVICRLNSGWWKGICNGKRGWFPSNFVQEIDFVQEKSRNSNVSSQKTKANSHVKAMFNFEAQDDSQLSFKKGDIIKVIIRLNSGWWDGICNGKRGWFPSNFVQDIDIAV